MSFERPDFPLESPEADPVAESVSELEADVEEKLEEEKREEREESKEKGEELKENDLIISELSIEHAKKLLKENDVQYEVREYMAREIIDHETKMVAPAEFVLTIFDKQFPDRPAPFDFVKQVFELIRDADIAVRYGKNPEKGEQ